jgi:uncharacterized membrane protein
MLHWNHGGWDVIAVACVVTILGFWAILLGVVIWTIAKYTRSPPPRGHEGGLPRKSPDHPFPPPHLRSPQRVLAPAAGVSETQPSPISETQPSPRWPVGS